METHMSLFRLSPLGLAGLARGVAANRLPLARNERKPLFNWSMTEDTNPRSRGQDELHDFSSGAAPRYSLRLDCAMMPGKLQQEVHHGHYHPADSSRGPFTVGPGCLTASGSRSGDRPPAPAPSGACALVRAGSGSLGARDSGWRSCSVQGRATIGRAWHGGVAAARAHAGLAA